METGTPGVKSTPDGWLNRLLSETAQAEVEGAQSIMRGMALTQQEPRAFSGAEPSLAVGNLQQFLGGDGPPVGDTRPADRDMTDDRMDSPPSSDRRRTPQNRTPSGDARRREALYGKDEEDLVLTTGAEALEAVAYLKAADPLRYRPENNARYPRGLGIQLQQVAQLIKADIGLEIAFTDIGGWDTHRQQGGDAGRPGESPHRIQFCARGVRSGSRRPDGGRCRAHDVGIRPYRRGERQRRHRPRARQRLHGAGR